METLRHISPAFVDHRGAISNLFEGPLGHVALITSTAGSVRGNHYHNHDHQYIYLISGAYESHCCPVDEPDNRQVLHVRPGDIVETPPRIAHAQRFTEDSVFLALTTREREDGKYEADTIAYAVVDGYLNEELKSE